MSNAGRPTDYNEEVALRLCTEISTSSKSLKTICSDEDMPSVRTVLYWLNKHPEFVRQYARAKEEQADYLVEEMIDIADDGSNDLMTIVKGDVEYETENKEVTNRSKLRVETRKWIASKLKAKKYGDKLDLSVQQESVDLSAFSEEELLQYIQLQNKLNGTVS